MSEYHATPRDLLTFLMTLVFLAIGYELGQHHTRSLLVRHGLTHEFAVGAVRCGAPVTYLRASDSILVATNEPTEIER